MTSSTKAAVIGLLLVLIVAAVALVWYILQPQVLIDTATLSVVRDGSTITVHDLVADEVYTFRIGNGSCGSNGGNGNAHECLRRCRK